MGMRAFVVGLLLLLGGCEYCYAVSRGKEGAARWDAFALQKAAQSQSSIAQVMPWDGICLVAAFRKGEAHVTLHYEIGPESAGLFLWSDWWGVPPDYSVLCASLALQDEILRSFAAEVAGFPAATDLPLEWAGLHNPRGAQFAEVKARYEAEHGL